MCQGVLEPGRIAAVSAALARYERMARSPGWPALARPGLRFGPAVARVMGKERWSNRGGCRRGRGSDQRAGIRPAARDAPADADADVFALCGGGFFARFHRLAERAIPRRRVRTIAALCRVVFARGWLLDRGCVRSCAGERISPVEPGRHVCVLGQRAGPVVGYRCLALASGCVAHTRAAAL